MSTNENGNGNGAAPPNGTAVSRGFLDEARIVQINSRVRPTVHRTAQAVAHRRNMSWAAFIETALINELRAMGALPGQEQEAGPAAAAGEPLTVLPATAGQEPVTMSSHEIAEIADVRHDNVMRDIRKMLHKLGENALKFEGVYRAGNGEDRPCFHLPKDLTLTLVAGYKVRLRKQIIDRWLELERRAAGARPALPAQPTPALPARPSVRARLKDIQPYNKYCTTIYRTVEDKMKRDFTKKKTFTLSLWVWETVWVYQESRGLTEAEAFQKLFHYGLKGLYDDMFPIA